MESILIKVFLPTAIAFTLGMMVTPLITRQLYKNRVWKKKAGKGNGYGGGGTPIFDELHKEKDTNTPRMGGLVIIVATVLTVVVFWLLGNLDPDGYFSQIDFLSRSQTWLPLVALLIGAVVGFLDDLLVVTERGGHFAGGLSLYTRMGVVALTALFSGWWFYEKLEVSAVNVIGVGLVDIGIWFIPFFLFVAVCIYMSSVIDGLDGLSGGVFMFIFMAYAGIAYHQTQYDLAALCTTIVGGILAFLWFNIPPARFYMTETGIMALTMCLTIVVFMTDTLGGGEGVSLLPIIGILLVATVGANTMQILSKKIWGKKVFLVAPLHHHFEALGWPAYKVTMRYWVLGFVAAVVGMILAVSF
jgi:phospho-N-acetylmuramoyl-pentapeptide-transferase